RAEAAQLAGRDGDAQRDLQNALRELRGEESQMLARRRPGEGEPYWSAYFNRFRETYDRLIRQLVDRGQWEPAFDYAERSRAYEPLNLILQRGVAPEAFRRLVPLYVCSLLRDEELSSSGPPTALLFGDPNFNSQLDLARGLKRLPRAKSEVERIAGAFCALAVVRTGDAATVPEFLALAKNKAI